MNDQQINEMVSRFLAWRLPENFNPDGGISFAPTYNTWGGGTARAEPVGTNLFSFDQAKQMVLHMLGEAALTPTAVDDSQKPDPAAPDPAAIREAALREAAAMCDIAPCDEWNDECKEGYVFAADECKRTILALIQKGAADDRAEQLEAALRRIADTDPDEGTAWFHRMANAALKGADHE